MSNYCAILYAIIGKRIRERRKNANPPKSQIDIIGEPEIYNHPDLPSSAQYWDLDELNTNDDNWISQGTLSLVENGKIDRSLGNRNPYFLNVKNIIKLRIDGGDDVISASDLIWGNPDQQEDLVKLWVLATTLNSEWNPFFPQGRKLKKANKQFPNGGIGKQDTDISYFKNKSLHGESLYDLYERTKSPCDDNLREISRLLFHGVLQSHRFSRDYFYTQMAHYGKRTGTKGKAFIQSYLPNFVLGYESPGDILQSLNGPDWSFCEAFEQLWGRVKEPCLGVFKSELFDIYGEKELHTHGMKNINEDLIRGVFRSEKLHRSIEEALLIYDYLDFDAVRSHCAFRIWLSCLGQMANAAGDQQALDTVLNEEMEKMVRIFNELDQLCREPLGLKGILEENIK